jgi:hypothetical protein
VITSTDSQSPGMRDDRRGTVQRQARKALLRELAGLLVSFGAVAMALHLQGVGSAQFAYVTLVLAVLAEILFLWRSVWAALALVAVSRTLPGRLHLILGTAVATWGTRSARRSVCGHRHDHGPGGHPILRRCASGYGNHHRHYRIPVELFYDHRRIRTPP